MKNQGTLLKETMDKAWEVIHRRKPIDCLVIMSCQSCKKMLNVFVPTGSVFNLSNQCPFCLEGNMVYQSVVRTAN